MTMQYKVIIDPQAKLDLKEIYIYVDLTIVFNQQINF